MTPYLLKFFMLYKNWFDYWKKYICLLLHSFQVGNNKLNQVDWFMPGDNVSFAGYYVFLSSFPASICHNSRNS